MMKYFHLSDDVHVPGRWHLGEATTPDGTAVDVAGTIDCSGGSRLSVKVSHPGRPLEFCLTSFAVPIAKRELAEAIAVVAGRDLLVVPALVNGDSSFAVLSVRRVVACLDEKRSEYLKWTDRDHRADLAGQYRMVTKLWIDTRKVWPATHIFRIDGWTVALIVSQRLRDLMESIGCVGAVFEEVS